MTIQDIIKELKDLTERQKKKASDYVNIYNNPQAAAHCTGIISGADKAIKMLQEYLKEDQ